MLTDTSKNENGQPEFSYHLNGDENIILKETMISSLSVAIVGLRQKIREIELRQNLTIKDHRELCKFKISKTTLQLMLNQFRKPQTH